jgi:hypothetical protein
MIAASDSELLNLWDERLAISFDKNAQRLMMTPLGRGLYGIGVIVRKR